MGFDELGLRPELVQALAGLGYEEPTPIQREAIPPLLASRDLLGQAATGTGKTAAFALPLLHRLDAVHAQLTAPMGLVLVPTRELAMQVSQAIHRYGRELGARVLPIYGGQPIHRQLKALTRGVDVVVATPGRAVDHLGRGTLDLGHLEVVVLDEADEMLDMGFADDLDTILAATPDYHQTMLFSATMPPRIDRLARQVLHEPVRVTIGRGPSAEDAGSTPRIREVVYVVPRAYKPAALARVLDVEVPEAALVFCRTRTEVDELAETMNGRGYRAEPLHGGMSQDQRDKVMQRLRTGAADLIVATDVAARGLDVDVLTHVVNYDVPAAPESYVHRIGRVGRAGREGVAVTLVEPREHRTLKSIERHTGRRMTVEKLPTVADLRSRRLELTRAALRESLLEDDLDGFRVVVESLTDEFDLVEVALAAVKLAHDAEGGSADDDEDLPDVRLLEDRGATRGHSGRGGSGGRGSRGGPGGRDDGSGVQPRTERGGAAGARGRPAPPSDMARVFIGAGRTAGIRPKDLVGAIAGESRLAGRDIGAIEITQNFSLVEVPASAADEVIRALRSSTVKGRRVTVRHDRDTRGR